MGKTTEFYAQLANSDLQTFSWSEWHLHPSVIIGLLFLASTYLLLYTIVIYRTPAASDVSLRRAGIFFAGLILMFITLQGPLHELSDHFLFSAHMVQHLLLGLVIPALLIAGTSESLIRPLMHWNVIRESLKFLTRPVLAFALFNIVLIMWHLPPLYDVTLREHSIHILEHLMFLIVGVIAWWPILSPLQEIPKSSYPIQLLYIFAQSVPMGFLGAIITFADGVLYTFYAEAPRIFFESPLTDQQMGGVIMKSTAGILFLFALTIVYFTWVKREGESI